MAIRRFWWVSALTLGIVMVLAQPVKRTGLPRLVNPLIGTDWVGNTYPGASVPFGMVQLSPDNGLPGWDRIAGYYYPDSTIAGFSHTHLSGTGAGDLYDISFMPMIQPALEAEKPLGLHARFSHADEEAHAGYYAVTLQPYDIRVELTATARMGIQRYTFHRSSGEASVILDLEKAMNWDKTDSVQIHVTDGRFISGFRYSDGWARRQRVYFYSRLSRVPKDYTLSRMKGILTLNYEVEAGDTLLIETAISGTSIADAKANFLAERSQSGFPDYLARAEHAWQRHLSTIELGSSATEEQQRIFYTALYHAQLCPTLYSNVDGSYLGPDRLVHRGEGAHYSTFSLWDTYRSAHPLYNIILPEASKNMVQSLIDFGQQNQGILPVWNMWASETDMMIGHHSLPVIMAALEGGVYKPRDPKALRALVLATLERQHYRAMDVYRRLGYVPSDVHRESLSLTLEYAYDDWAGARILELLGYAADAIPYHRSASNYRNLWDATSGFFRPRLLDGSFKDGFDPFAYTEDVTESNAYQYLWSLQHHPDSLVLLMGGAAALAKRLDTFFAEETPKYVDLPIFSTGMMGQYAHGNEPGHHVPYLYHYAKRPWQTVDVVHRILREQYDATPRGLCGNEDCGQMSAWYVLSAIGLYPLEGGADYLISTPLYEEVTLRPIGAKPFVIRAKNLSKANRYIQSVRLNGKPYHQMKLRLGDLRAGGELELIMGPTPTLWY